VKASKELRPVGVSAAATGSHRNPHFANGHPHMRAAVEQLYVERRCPRQTHLVGCIVSAFTLMQCQLNPATDETSRA
jgi:hypothetical protein